MNYCFPEASFFNFLTFSVPAIMSNILPTVIICLASKGD